MTATLRRAVPGDERRLALLGAATFLASFAHDHPGEALCDHVDRCHAPDWYARALADPARTIWIVETPLRAPIGYAVLTPPDLACPTGPDDLELKRIYVLGPWQKDGWGARLLAAVEADARARGAARLLLCVYTVNHAARRFYARAGFAATGARQVFMVGDIPFEDEIWSKMLRPGSAPMQDQVEGASVRTSASPPVTGRR